MTKAKARDYFMKFIPAVWRSEPTLANCSLAARGLWIELMCVAHDHAGLVLVNGKSPTVDEIARQVRSGPEEVRISLEELQRNGVCSLRPDGTIYSRRMVRESKKRQTNRKNGAKGGNPTLLAKRDNQSDNRDDNQNPIIRSDQHLTSNSKISSLGSSEDLDLRKESPRGNHFDAFWAAFPKKVAKGAARVAWRKHKPDIVAVLSALEWQVNQTDWLKEGGQFCPRPAAWLNQHRWEDEPFTPAEYIPPSNTKTGHTVASLGRTLGAIERGEI